MTEPQGDLSVVHEQVREQQHQIRDMEKEAAGLRGQLEAAKKDTTSARQQLVRKAHLAERDMQVAKAEAAAHAESINVQVRCDILVFRAHSA